MRSRAKETLEIASFGQIVEGSITIGDLTVLVGEQASGKSLLLELFKFIHDYKFVRKKLSEKGFSIQEKEELQSLYFGYPMGNVPIKENTQIKWKGEEFSFDDMKKRSSTERVFYIPAQRTLTMIDGWFRDFSSFGVDTPFVVRHFSETMRSLIEKIRASQRDSNVIFPASKRFYAQLRKKLDAAIFKGWNLYYREEGMRKLLVLNHATNTNLSFLSWSTGQREFVPLLIGLYWLMPSGRKVVRNYDYVVIEEPEMGLHPHGYLNVLLLILLLLKRGYRVLLSSHSPTTLDAIWVLRNIAKVSQESKKLDLFCRFFDIKKEPWLISFVQDLTSKRIHVHYFQSLPNGKTIIDDITKLEDLDNPAIEGWGGLLSISDRASNIVSEAVQSIRQQQYEAQSTNGW